MQTSHIHITTNSSSKIKKVFSKNTMSSISLSFSAALLPLNLQQDVNTGCASVSSKKVIKNQLGPIIRRSFSTTHRVPGFSGMVAESGNVQSPAVPTSVPVRVANELLQAGHRYLDVRTTEEYSGGHVVGAVNVPFMLRRGSEDVCVEDQSKGDAKVACFTMLHKDDLAIGHVKGNGARDIARTDLVPFKSDTEVVSQAPAVHLDHKRTWRDVAVQGALKKSPPVSPPSSPHHNQIFSSSSASPPSHIPAASSLNGSDSSLAMSESSVDSQPPQNAQPPQNTQSTHPMTTRARAGIFKPKVYSLAISPSLLPRSALEALLIPRNGEVIYLLIYVDDMLITASLGLRGRVEDQSKGDAKVACFTMLHKDDLAIGHVKGNGARDIARTDLVPFKSDTEVVSQAPAVHLDHKRTWRDVAVQGALKKSRMARNPKFLEEVSAHFRKDDEIIVVGSGPKLSSLACAGLG
ncbi:hypothetical protein SASPL_125155 [Salvia splendens]|uniref:Rhodanese domain-containing protein n=1 Tax=Salvia splendens TaxID=180675 RepID=A0A8X8XET3_SALSN|nr:hypothetical protein SASPL_125155 [Salvia splendens]